MRIRTLVVALAVAAPLLALESRPAAAFGWCVGAGAPAATVTPHLLAMAITGTHLAPTATHLATTATPSHLRRSLLRPTFGLARLRLPRLATDTEGSALAA